MLGSSMWYWALAKCRYLEYDKIECSPAWIRFLASAAGGGFGITISFTWGINLGEIATNYFETIIAFLVFTGFSPFCVKCPFKCLSKTF